MLNHLTSLHLNLTQIGDAGESDSTGATPRDFVSRDIFYKELKNLLTDATMKREMIIVVGHHPIHAKGKHSLPLVFLERLSGHFADSNTNYLT